MENMNKIIPAFRDSILKIRDSLGEWAEWGIDSVLDNEGLKDIPIVGTIRGFCKFGYSIHERNLLNQTLAFIKGMNAKTISEENISRYKEKLNENSKSAENELSRVIIILNSHIETLQSSVLGNFFRAYVNRAISWEKLSELAEANRRMFAADYPLLKHIYENPDMEISEKRMYQIDRLISSGLVEKENIATGETRLGSSTFVVLPSGMKVTSFGKTFCQHMGIDE